MFKRVGVHFDEVISYRVAKLAVDVAASVAQIAAAVEGHVVGPDEAARPAAAVARDGAAGVVPQVAYLCCSSTAGLTWAKKLGSSECPAVYWWAGRVAAADRNE